MLFASFTYILFFLPAVVLLTMLARKLAGPRAAQGCILLASMVFYGWHKPGHLVYLAGSIAANWSLAKLMGGAEQSARKRYLQFGLLLNIGFLSVFKYSAFFLTMIPYGISDRLQVSNVDFPLGISFFTIIQIMYLMDCYEGLLLPSNLYDYATFVSFFPYVISGPIARAKRILHQTQHFGDATGPRSGMMARGVFLFSIGLLKKVVFADSFAQVAGFGASSRQSMSALEAWVFSIAFTLQIYFDFSGYSDMAIASALMLGIEIPRNFDAPFRSTSIIEFWRRWHISLTAFITTYLYTPILKAFRSATLVTASIATLIAMTIAGLWHGPSWNYVCFGLLHGFALATNQIWKRKKLPIPNWIAWILTFSFVNIALIVFHTHTLHEARDKIGNLFRVSHALGIASLVTMRQQGIVLHLVGPPVLISTFVAFFWKSSEQLAMEFKPSVKSSVVVVVLTWVSWVFMNSTISTPFVYFAF